MKQLRIERFFYLVFLLLLPWDSSKACTVCDTATGKRLQEVLSQDLLSNLLAVLAPFLVLAILVKLILKVGPDETSH